MATVTRQANGRYGIVFGAHEEAAVEQELQHRENSDKPLVELLQAMLDSWLSNAAMHAQEARRRHMLESYDRLTEPDQEDVLEYTKGKAK
jgi:hypothetical protein